MTKQSRQRLSTLVRYVICVVAVTWLVTHTEWAQLKQVVGSANWRLVVVSILAFGPAPVLIAIRLKLLLAVHDVKLTVWQALRVTFACTYGQGDGSGS